MAKARVLIVQHQTAGGPGALAPALARAGCALDLRNVEAGAGLPEDDAGFAGLVVLGGVMGANDDDQYPHLARTRALIRAFHAAGKPVLGLCLGAQLAARALGGRVFRMAAPELGFVPLSITGTGAGDALLAGAPSPIPILEWHMDGFEPPPGSTLLMTGAACPNQAFRAGRATYGFQCHFEATRAMIDDWVAHSRAVDRDAAHRAFHARIDAERERHLARALTFCDRVAARWAALVTRSDSPQG